MRRQWSVDSLLQHGVYDRMDYNIRRDKSGLGAKWKREYDRLVQHIAKKFFRTFYIPLEKNMHTYFQ